MAQMKIMVDWVNKQLVDYPEAKVTDLSKSFQNGRAFCALVHHFGGTLDYPSLSFSDTSQVASQQKLHLAFSIAKSSLGIPNLIDAEDIVVCPDNKSIYVYLLEFLKKFGKNTTEFRPQLQRSQTQSAMPSPRSPPTSTPIQPVTAKPVVARPQLQRSYTHASTPTDLPSAMLREQKQQQYPLSPRSERNKQLKESMDSLQVLSPRGERSKLSHSGGKSNLRSEIKTSSSSTSNFSATSKSEALPLHGAHTSQPKSPFTVDSIPPRSKSSTKIKENSGSSSIGSSNSGVSDTKQSLTNKSDSPRKGTTTSKTITNEKSFSSPPQVTVLPTLKLDAIKKPISEPPKKTIIESSNKDSPKHSSTNKSSSTSPNTNTSNNKTTSNISNSKTTTSKTSTNNIPNFNANKNDKLSSSNNSAIVNTKTEVNTTRVKEQLKANSTQFSTTPKISENNSPKLETKLKGEEKISSKVEEKKTKKKKKKKDDDVFQIEVETPLKKLPLVNPPKLNSKIYGCMEQSEVNESTSLFSKSENTILEIHDSNIELDDLTSKKDTISKKKKKNSISSHSKSKKYGSVVKNNELFLDPT